MHFSYLTCVPVLFLSNPVALSLPLFSSAKSVPPNPPSGFPPYFRMLIIASLLPLVVSSLSPVFSTFLLSLSPPLFSFARPSFMLSISPKFLLVSIEYFYLSHAHSGMYTLLSQTYRFSAALLHTSLRTRLPSRRSSRCTRSFALA